MRPINRTLVVLLRETYFSLSEKFDHDSSSLPRQGDWDPWCSGTLTLVIIRPRAGESQSSRDFTKELITFREFISLNLALTAASGINFPCSSFCIWLICREGFRPCFPVKLSLEWRKIIACLLSSPHRQNLGLSLFKVEPVLPCRWGQDCVLGSVWLSHIGEARTWLMLS